MEERSGFKKRVKSELEFHGIRAYPFMDMDEEFYQAGSEEEKLGKQSFRDLKVCSHGLELITCARTRLR
jgi:septin 3/9/12